MNEKLKIGVVTGARSEYGLFKPLLDVIKKDGSLDLQIFVTGMHLSPEFGLTYKEIEKDGFTITEKVEMLLSADSDSAITKSTGLGLIGFADVFKKSRPDWLIVLGDRFETFAAAFAAFLSKIPIAHIHGGEVTEGATDDSIRHTITKLSFLHFTSTEVYRKRVIQLGEDPSRVFNVGAIGLDNIKNLSLLSREELENSLGIKLLENFVLVTYHPVTLDKQSSAEHFQSLLNALSKQKDLQIIFTMPNADADSRVIVQLIQQFASNNTDRVHFFTNMGQLRYLSALKHCYAVIGNSSSGIIEAPSFGIPVINIGDRQKGRVIPDNVIQANPDENSIDVALSKIKDSSIREKAAKTTNQYWQDDTALKIIEQIKNHGKLHSTKKAFYDL
jgi:GDP/UDP-N,N'-diacetylbacillosamine 2-epimerase (hydrolysing)